MATMSVLAAALPLAGVAQEGLPAEVAPAPIRRFVSDKLVLNVYAEPEQGSARVATIQTGDVLEELQRAGNMVRVRLEDAREGWVGASYLMNDPPAVVRLRELQRQSPSTAPRLDKAAVEELAQLKKENAALRGQVGQLQSRLAAAPVAAHGKEQNSEPDKIVEAPARDAALAAATLAGAAPSGGIWGWLIAILFIGAMSFAGGYQTLAHRLRRKFGGLKVY
ncbi:MAG: SH3 domain-containing protein [Pseudomonadota bacterium]|nr:SH3 domain-containing protein [Pseudomonadota bacterium]